MNINIADGMRGCMIISRKRYAENSQNAKQRRHIKLNCVSLLLRLKDLKFKHLINFQPGY